MGLLSANEQWLSLILLILRRRYQYTVGHRVRQRGIIKRLYDYVLNVISEELFIN